MQVDLVGIAADELDESLAHGHDPGIGEGQAKDILGLGIRIEQDLADPTGEDLGFSGARSGNDHHRTFYGIDRLFLFVIQGSVGLFKILQ